MAPMLIFIGSVLENGIDDQFEPGQVDDEAAIDEDEFEERLLNDLEKVPTEIKVLGLNGDATSKAERPIQ